MKRHKAMQKQVKKTHFKKKKAPSDISVKALFKDSLHYLDITGNDPPTMHLWGNRGLYIEHYEKILEYTGVHIRLQLKHMQIFIRGQTLVLEYFSRHELKIRGDIEIVQFMATDRGDEQ